MFGWEREEAWQRFADAQDLRLALADLRRAVDDYKLYVAHERIAALELELKYRPDQPRVPAGYREGGQWTRDGSGTPSAARRREQDNDFGGELATALGVGMADAAERAPPRTSYRVDILEEDQLGGHTYEKHVGKDDTFLLDRVRAGQGRTNFPFFAMRFGVLRAGSFSSLKAANALTSATLAENSDIVDAVAAGKYGRRSKFVTALFGSATGREAYANTTNQSVRMRTTYGVGVWVQYAPEIPKGYVVVTAYPRSP